MKALLFLRSFLVTFLIGPLITFSLCFVVVFCVLILRSHRIANRFILAWGKMVCLLYGVRLYVEGEENVPAGGPGGGAMFLFNHTSFFDIISLYAIWPFLRFGAKLELFSIPIFGPTMRAVGTLPIARANRDAAIRVLQDAQERARQGERFALSPEGGRNREEKLLPFKAGPFLFAIQAQVPLVPVVIRGAVRVWPKNSLLPATSQWFSEIRLKVLPPIPTTGFTIEQRADLQEKVRGAMEAELARPVVLNSRAESSSR